MMFSFENINESKFGIVMLTFCTSQAMASSGVITISGQVYEASCQVSTASNNIKLDSILKTNINGKGSFGDKAHSILVTGCPSNVTPTFKFSENAPALIYNSTSGLLVNSGNAEGVYVQLKEGNGEEINITTFSHTLAAGDNNIPIKVAYYAESVDAVKIGSVSASINYEINYN
jgi:type 1 fimbria pilin